MPLLIQLAGLLHFLIAVTNFFAARLFHYRDNMARDSPFIREVFWVQNIFIVLTTLAMGCLCLKFPHELAGETALGRSLSAFFGLFWATRLGVQLFFYDAQAKRRFPLANKLFTLVFVYLTLIFGLTTFAPPTP